MQAGINMATFMTLKVQSQIPFESLLFGLGAVGVDERADAIYGNRILL